MLAIMEVGHYLDSISQTSSITASNSSLGSLCSISVVKGENIELLEVGLQSEKS